MLSDLQYYELQLDTASIEMLIYNHHTINSMFNNWPLALKL